MSELYSFTTGDGKFKMTVKSEFLKKCEDPSKLNHFDLLTIHKVNQFFHNPSGPAIVRNRDNYSEYWIDGQKVSEEEGKRIAHAFQFNNKLMSEVGNNSDNVLETKGN